MGLNYEVTGGPCKNNEGRLFVIIKYKNGEMGMKSYPKYLVEVYLERELDPDLETIDHIDNNFHNNDLSNLRIIDRSNHSKQDSLRAKSINLQCLWCDIRFERRASYHAHNQKQGKDGPFCGRSCGAKYGREKQLGRIESCGNNYIDNREYYRLKDNMDIKSNLDDYKIKDDRDEYD